MNAIQVTNVTASFGQHFELTEINWSLQAEQHWAVVGPNGAGKSALVAMLAGRGDIVEGEINGLPERVAWISFEAQAELIDLERKKDDADLLDVIPEGTPVQEILDQTCTNRDIQQKLIDAFHIRHLLDQGFRKLSSGETRKLMLIRGLSSNPELLLMDEPFEGLDADSHVFLRELLEDSADKIPMVLVLNRFDEIPDYVTHLAYVDQGKLIHALDRSDESAMGNLAQLVHLKTTNIEIPAADIDHRAPSPDSSNPLVRIRNGKVSYGDTIIFQNLNWTIEPGQHWQVTGPNGSGKTCLLNLITGDHPQCYVNDIFVFGMQRGSGESIWDIKQHIGYVSSALQWEYTVSVSVRNTIISGFYDSIGIYQKYSDIQGQIADQWLQLLGMEAMASRPFNSLSFGDQRLILIARAMVKHPPLLILDEPCLGLDDLNRQLVLALIEKICAGSETTVLYVNHRTEDKIDGINNHLPMAPRQA